MTFSCLAIVPSATIPFIGVSFPDVFFPGSILYDEVVAGIHVVFRVEEVFVFVVWSFLVLFTADCIVIVHHHLLLARLRIGQEHARVYYPLQDCVLERIDLVESGRLFEGLGFWINSLDQVSVLSFLKDEKAGEVYRLVVFSGDVDVQKPEPVRKDVQFWAHEDLTALTVLA